MIASEGQGDALELNGEDEEDWSAVDHVPPPRSVPRAAAGPRLCFGSVDEFVREFLAPTYRRKIHPQGQLRWSARWWESAEAVSRLDALWRAFERCRVDPAFGMSTWWRDHADPTMTVLMSDHGPFADSRDTTKGNAPLPSEPPPAGMFTDERNLPTP